MGTHEAEKGSCCVCVERERERERERAERVSPHSLAFWPPVLQYTNMVEGRPIRNSVAFMERDDMQHYEGAVGHYLPCVSTLCLPEVMTRFSDFYPLCLHSANDQRLEETSFHFLSCHNTSYIACD